jgi:hypothetical protein
MIIVVAAVAALIAAVIGGLIGANVASQQTAGPGSGTPTTTGTIDPLDLYDQIQAEIDAQREAYEAIDYTDLEDARSAVEDAVDSGDDPTEALDAYEAAYGDVAEQWDAILAALDELEQGDLAELEAQDPTLAQGLRSAIETLRGDIEDDMMLFPSPEELGVEPCEDEDCEGDDEDEEEEEEPETVEATEQVWEAVITYERLETGVDVITACENLEDPLPGEQSYENARNAFIEAHLSSEYEFASFTYTSAEPITPAEGELLLEFMARVLAADEEAQMDEDEEDNS